MSWKLSCPVLRGGESGDARTLPDDTKIEIPDRHAIYYSSAHSLQIVHPYLMLEWIRKGELPKIPSQYPLLRRPMIEAADRTILQGRGSANGVTQARGAYTQVLGINLKTSA